MKIITLFCFLISSLLLQDNLINAQTSNEKVVINYMKARQTANNIEALKYVTDDIVLKRPFFSTVKGKKQFEKYLTETKSEGDWKIPKEKNGKVTVVGKNIQSLLGKVSVKVSFKFKNNIISEISIKQI